MAKNRELVVYDNDLNMIALKNMTQIENDVFFALLYKLKNQGTNEVRLNFSELKTLIGFEYQNNEHIRKSILNIAEKIAKSVVKYVDEKETQFFTLFQVLAIPNDDDYYIRAKISEPFAYLLNELDKSFTAFELAEFSSLSSKYTQTLYRLLKQYKKTGYMIISWQKFKELLDIPQSYETRDINKQILKPAIAELTASDIYKRKNRIFEKLLFRKIRGKGRGRPVESIEFYFTPRKETQKEQKRSDRALEIIADEIWSQKELKKLKANKETIKQQEPQILETRTGIFGNQVSDLTAYINCHFYVKNKFDGGNDTCKIKELYQNQDGTIYGLAINQENNKKFRLNFESLKHLKNALNL